MATKEEIDRWLSDAQGPWTVDELRAAFTAVQNPEHWKMGIDAIVPADMDPDLIDRAVTWFTSSLAEITEVRDSEGMLTGWHVRADGYWSAGMDG